MEDDQTATVAFLRAEEVATRLTDELKRLDDESQRYNGAAATLESAGERLRLLADAVQTSGERTSEVMTAIQGVGAPAIIDGLEHVNVSVREALASNEKAIGALDGMMSMDTTHAEELSQIRAALVEQLTATRTTVADEVQKTRNAIANMETANAAAQKTNYEAIAAVRSALAEASDNQARRTRVVLVISACAAVLAGVASIMPFFR